MLTKIGLCLGIGGFTVDEFGNKKQKNENMYFHNLNVYESGKHIQNVKSINSPNQITFVNLHDLLNR